MRWIFPLLAWGFLGLSGCGGDEDGSGGGPGLETPLLWNNGGGTGGEVPLRQAELEGRWEGTWNGEEIEFTMDAFGVITSGVAMFSDQPHTVSGLLVVYAGTTEITGQMQFRSTSGIVGFITRAMGAVSPGQGGAAFQIVGTFKDGSQLDVSGP